MKKRSDESILGHPLYQLQAQGQVVHVDLDIHRGEETQGEGDRKIKSDKERDEGRRDESVFQQSFCQYQTQGQVV